MYISDAHYYPGVLEAAFEFLEMNPDNRVFVVGSIYRKTESPIQYFDGEGVFENDGKTVKSTPCGNQEGYEHPHWEWPLAFKTFPLNDEFSMIQYQHIPTSTHSATFAGEIVRGVKENAATKWEYSEYAGVSHVQPTKNVFGEDVQTYMMSEYTEANGLESAGFINAITNFLKYKRKGKISATEQIYALSKVETAYTTRMKAQREVITSAKNTQYNLSTLSTHAHYLIQHSKTITLISTALVALLQGKFSWKGLLAGWMLPRLGYFIQAWKNAGMFEFNLKNAAFKDLINIFYNRKLGQVAGKPRKTGALKTVAQILWALAACLIIMHHRQFLIVIAKRALSVITHTLLDLPEKPSLTGNIASLIAQVRGWFYRSNGNAIYNTAVIANTAAQASSAWVKNYSE